MTDLGLLFGNSKDKTKGLTQHNASPVFFLSGKFY